VFTVGADGRARLAPLEIGEMNDEMAVVRRGLRPGMRVILHPGDRVREGVRVRARE
jgi:HlyD family secretion protein